MTKIVDCAKCGSKDLVIMDHPKAVSNSSGNKYHKPARVFYVCCKQCGSFGEFCDSSRYKAVASWNRKQKHILKSQE